MLITGSQNSRDWARLLVLLAVSCNNGSISDDAASPSDADELGASTSNVGAICDLLTDAGVSQGTYNAEALECATRMCLKPTMQPGAAGSSTTAFCTAPCKQDSDCAGQKRDPANPLDTRCATGFACGILFVKGALCCQKLCVCQDFIGSSGMATPIACQGDAAAGCHQ